MTLRERFAKIEPVEVVLTLAEIVVLVLVGQYCFDLGVKSERSIKAMRTENEVQAYFAGYDCCKTNGFPKTFKALSITNPILIYK